jgi:hypothetical protein
MIFETVVISHSFGMSFIYLFSLAEVHHPTGSVIFGQVRVSTLNSQIRPILLRMGLPRDGLEWF